jgi:hypothetical protein
MSSQQVFKVIGELEIVSKTGAYEANNALLSFKYGNGSRLASIRTYGSGPYNFMLIDATQCLGGLELRGTTDEGSSTVGGKGDYMSFTVREGKCGAKFMIIKQYPFVINGFTAMYGNPNLEVFRQSTKDAFNLRNVIADYSQDVWKAGEEMALSLGFNRNYGSCYWGYTTPTGTSSDANNTAYIGMYPSFNTLRKNLVFANSGDTSTAYKFTAGTISATTYLNLPATPPPNLTPITLDAANLRVGIDTPTPQYTLDVNGDGHFMGTVTADTGLLSQEIIVAKATVDNQLLLPNIPSATKTKILYYDATSHGVSFGDAPASPPPSVLPLTLDTTNNRVGVNITVPEEALDVSGNIQATGDLTVDGLLYFQGMPDAVTNKVLYFDTTTKKVSYGTAPVSDVLPITLDKTNNRVGVNITVPEEALDVDGNIQTTGDLTVDGQVYLQGLLSESYSQVLYYNLINKKVSYGPAPSTSVLPITLDNVNNRVGINQLTPLQALDVTGNARVTGTIYSGPISASQASLTGRLALSGDGGVVNLYGGNQTPATTSGTINPSEAGSLYMSTLDGNVYIHRQAGSSSWDKVLTEYNMPSPSVLPITLDTTNNRVGINRVTPTQALDVTGVVKATSYRVGTGFTNIFSGTTDPNITYLGSCDPGSLFLRNQTTTSIPCLYVKTTNNSTQDGWVGIGGSSSSSVVMKQLKADVSIGSTSTTFLTFVLPSIGTYEIALALKPSLAQTAVVAIATSNTVTSSYPTCIRVISTATIPINQTTYKILYTTTTAGSTHYVNATSANAFNMVANETQLVATYKGVFP